MSERQPDVDLRAAVIVPARPGPLVRLQDLDRGRDGIDELLDAVFGEPDARCHVRLALRCGASDICSA